MKDLERLHESFGVQVQLDTRWVDQESRSVIPGPAKERKALLMKQQADRADAERLNAQDWPRMYRRAWFVGPVMSAALAVPLLIVAWWLHLRRVQVVIYLVGLVLWALAVPMIVRLDRPKDPQSD